MFDFGVYCDSILISWDGIPETAARVLQSTTHQPVITM